MASPYLAPPLLIEAERSAQCRMPTGGFRGATNGEAGDLIDMSAQLIEAQLPGAVYEGHERRVSTLGMKIKTFLRCIFTAPFDFTASAIRTPEGMGAYSFRTEESERAGWGLTVCATGAMCAQGGEARSRAQDLLAGMGAQHGRRRGAQPCIRH
jgi:hypothetical protein